MNISLDKILKKIFKFNRYRLLSLNIDYALYSSYPLLLALPSYNHLIFGKTLIYYLLNMLFKWHYSNFWNFITNLNTLVLVLPALGENGTGSYIITKKSYIFITLMVGNSIYG